jgi:hypothetical protein
MLFSHVTAEMLQADYWIRHSAKSGTTIMDAAAISAFNRAINRNLPDTCYELTAFPDRIDRNILESWLTAVKLPTESLYRDGQLLTPDYHHALQAKLNLRNLTTPIQVRYGFTVTRTNIRTFPTADRILAEPDRPEFDSFQETGLNPAEPLLILWQSPTADWSYIQTENYRGWTPTAALAITASRQEWLEYLRPEAFLVVTGSNIIIPGPEGAPPYYFEMGAKLPLATGVRPINSTYTVLLPMSNRQNRLQLRYAPLPATTDLHLGYLNYTRANLLRQAFKFHGQAYDWGGLQGGVDCSGLIMNTYRCFGFTFPRNSGEQAQLPGRRLELESLSPKQKKAALADLSPGAILYLKGHVVLYLGAVNDTGYILHALSSYGVPDQLGQVRKTYHLRVSVTDLSLLRADGRSFRDSLQGAVVIEF